MAAGKTRGTAEWLRPCAIICVILLTMVLVPFVLVGSRVDALITRLLASAADRDARVAAIIAVALAVDVLLPIPSSILATGAGYLLGFIRGAVAVFAGLTAGSLIGYAIGRGAAPVISGRLLGSAQREQVEALSVRWGDWAIAVSRPIPVLAETALILAGMTRFPPRRFLLVSGLANLAVAMTYALVGAISASSQAPWVALVAACALPVLATAASRRFRSVAAVASW